LRQRGGKERLGIMRKKERSESKKRGRSLSANNQKKSCESLMPSRQGKRKKKRGLRRTWLGRGGGKDHR